MLDDKLHDLTLQSRLRIMEMDRERIKVRDEWRNSRKRQLTINEAMIDVHGPDGDVFPLGGGPQNSVRKMSLCQNMKTYSKRLNETLDMETNMRLSTPAPQQINAGDAHAQQPTISRSMSFIQPHGHTRASLTKQFTKQPIIPKTCEYNIHKHERNLTVRRDSNGAIGKYVLDEFQKMSEVVPGILRALAKKKEQQQEADERLRLRDMKNEINVDLAIDNLIDYEPDMNKVRKTVSSVKKLRHRMAASKKLEASKPQKSLEEMIRDKTQNLGEYNEYTDGTCALMKRRLEKKRRESTPFVMNTSFMQRRQSAMIGTGGPPSRRGSLAPDQLIRIGSATTMQFPAPLTRSSTTLSLASTNRLNSFRMDSEDESPFIDEDLLVNRQRVLAELDKYSSIKERVNQFVG